MSEVEYGTFKPLTGSVQPEAVRAADTGARSEGSPLRSQEAFDAYCQQVQYRLAEYAAQRTHFLRGAFDRLTRLLQTARAVEDNSLYNELWQVRVAVRELLEALSQATTVSGAAPAPWQPSQQPSTPRPTSLHTSSSIHELRDSSSEALTGGPSPLAIRTASPLTPKIDAEVSRMPRQPMRPLVEIEAEAVQLRELVRTWNDVFPLKRENGDLHVPNALRLRGIACRMRRLEEEAADTEVVAVTELSNEIDALREAAGDHEYTVSADRELEHHPTAFQWGELAERHEETARAQEAFEWWVENRERLTVQDVQPLAESVAAIQQRFNRLLFRIGARDPFQQQLFDDLRMWARDAQCYLFSLRPKVPIVELVDKATKLDVAWEQARLPLAAAEGRGHAVEALIQLVNQPDFGSDIEKSSTELAEAVLQVKLVNTPATDPRLRAALLPWAALLEGDDRFRDTVREIQLDWESRLRAGRLDAVDVDSPETLKELSDVIEQVRNFTHSKRILVLGDVKSDAGMQKLREVLDPEELIWPALTTADTLSRLEAAVAGADLVVLPVRFSRKDWHGARSICEQAGKPCVQVAGVFPIAGLLQALMLLQSAAKK